VNGGWLRGRKPWQQCKQQSTCLAAGELAVKGDNLFLEYWNKEAATSESFDRDGYFL